MSVTILLHYGPTRTRLSTRSQPVTSSLVQPFPAAKPAVVLLDFYGTLARGVSRGPLAAELFARRGWVSFAVVSAGAGLRKPHPLIFRRALDLAGVGPAEAVFVGDSWEADVGGARSAGIAPVHVWREPSEPPPLVDGVRRIPDLRGLLDLV